MPQTIPPRPNTNRQLLGVAIGLFSLIVLSTASALSYASANRWLQHTMLVRQTAEEWELALLNAETGTRGYLVTRQADYLEPYNSAPKLERETAARMRRLVVDDPKQIQNVEAADRDAQLVMERLGVLVALVAGGRGEDAITAMSTGISKRLMDIYRRDMLRIREEEERMLAVRRASADWRAVLTMIGTGLMMITAFAVLALGRRREREHQELLRELARAARQRLAAMFDVASGLAEAHTRAQVADVIIEQGLRALAANTCSVYVLDESGSTLELVGDRGVAEGVIESIRRISEHEHPETFTRMREGKSVWAESEAEYHAIFPGLAAMKVDGPRAKAFWSVPLYVEGRAIGLLGMGFYSERVFSAEDRAFIETFAKQCAQALQRARRLESQAAATRWLTTTLRSIGDAVIATDAQGRIEFMNPVAEGLTRWTQDEARGRPLEEVFCIFSEQTGLPVESPVTKVLREGKVVGLANHTLLRSKHGIEIPIDDSGAPIRAENGQMHGVVLVFRDVTQEKRERVRREFLAKAGEVLVSSLDYHATLNAVAQLAVPTLADWCSIDVLEQGSTSHQVAVAHVDPSKVLFARELAERYPPDPEATTGAPNVIRTGKSELHREIPSAMLEAAARDDEHLRLLRQLQLESGIVVPLRTRGRTLGAITFVYAESARRYADDDLIFAEDFARRAALAIENALVMREAEAARTQERLLRREAEVASRAKDEFLATVSHELRTPLNAILGWAVILRDRELGPESARGLAAIERNARAQSKLIEDVLDVSRIISGKLALNITPTDVVEAVSAAIETVTPAAAAKGVALSSEMVDGELKILADPDRLQQIVWNLLSNAVKFTPKQGRVSVRVQRDGAHVCIHVSDTGEGIRPDALPLIFEPFHQADASTTRRHGGLGLGLAIVKQLVTAHGGTVHATSAGAGTGATFTVMLPAIANAAVIVRGAQPGASLDLREEIGESSAPSLDGLSVLVVDDEQDVLMIVSEVLSERGATVHLASSVSEALEVFTQVKPDVIVSDIGIPGEDGYSLIRKIRALSVELGGRTPALAFTAYARGEDARRAFAAGFQMHLAKPVDPAQLVNAVANLGGRSQG